MDVVLVDLTPRATLLKAPFWMPVYLSSIAALLRKDGHQVSIIEYGGLCDEPANAGEAPRANPFERLRDAGLVLFSVEAQQWHTFVSLAAMAREAYPHAVVLAGGRHPALCPEETIRGCPDVDIALVGEPENSVAALARGTPADEVPGLCLRSDGDTARTDGDATVEDLDSLPLPAWDLLDMAYHTRRTPRVIPCFPLRTATLQSSRGCAGRCTFCSEGRQYASVHRHHSAEYVLDAVHRLVAKYSIGGLYFSDETFLASRRRVAELCDLFIRNGIGKDLKWTAQVRTDSVDGEILAHMRRAGCVQLEFGIESGSPRVLEMLHKDADTDTNARAIRLSREAGIRSLALLMAGIPGETAEDLQQTADFIRTADPDIVRMTHFYPYPGTPLVRQLEDEGTLPRELWLRDDAYAAFRKAVPLSKSVLRTMRRVYFQYVFPRFFREYFRHNRPADMPADFRINMLWPFILRKLRI